MNGLKLNVKKNKQKNIIEFNTQNKPGIEQFTYLNPKYSIKLLDKK